MATYPGWRPDPSSGARQLPDGSWVDKNGNPISGDGRDTLGTILDPVGSIAQASGLGPALAKPVGDLLSKLDPAKGAETQAAAYREAQAQAQALSDLQWQRQMQGLQGALGHVDHAQSLWNSIYGGPPGGVTQRPDLNAGGLLMGSGGRPGNPALWPALDQVNPVINPPPQPRPTSVTPAQLNPGAPPPVPNFQYQPTVSATPVSTPGKAPPAPNFQYQPNLGGGTASGIPGGSGVQTQQGALTAPPPYQAPPPPISVQTTASRGLDSLLSQPPPAPVRSAAPGLDSYLAGPLPQVTAAPPPAPSPPLPINLATALGMTSGTSPISFNKRLF